MNKLSIFFTFVLILSISTFSRADSFFEPVVVNEHIIEVGDCFDKGGKVQLNYKVCQETREAEFVMEKGYKLGVIPWETKKKIGFTDELSTYSVDKKLYSQLLFGERMVEDRHEKLIESDQRVSEAIGNRLDASYLANRSRNNSTVHSFTNSNYENSVRREILERERRLHAELDAIESVGDARRERDRAYNTCERVRDSLIRKLNSTSNDTLELCSDSDM